MGSICGVGLRGCDVRLAMSEVQGERSERKKQRDRSFAPTGGDASYGVRAVSDCLLLYICGRCRVKGGLYIVRGVTGGNERNGTR